MSRWAARPTSAHHAGRDGLKRSVGAAMHLDTKPGARPRTPLAAAMLIPSSWTRPLIQAGRPGLNHGERADAGGFPGSTYADTKTGHAQGQDRRRAGAWHSASSLHAPLRHDMGSITREGCTVLGLRRRWLRFEPPSVAAP